MENDVTQVNPTEALLVTNSTVGNTPTDSSLVSSSRKIKVLRTLYTAHALSAWTSRAFEFGATLFMAVIFPGTLLYASAYALLRALVAMLLAGWVGGLVDRCDRLVVVRRAIIGQRGSIVGSCVLFGGMLMLDSSEDDGSKWWLKMGMFSMSVILAGVEKLAFLGNTVAVERDWVVVVALELEIERARLNAVMRRIDLLAKLCAPVVVSVIQTWWTVGAVLFVFIGGVGTVGIEWVFVGRVYSVVNGLKSRHIEYSRTAFDVSEYAGRVEEQVAVTKSRRSTSFEAWLSYLTSPVFLPSFSLSLLYLTVLSLGPQFQTYLLSSGFNSLDVSLLRLFATISELSATCFAPLLMKRIGDVRTGLWSINWQLTNLALGVLGFVVLANEGWPRSSGASLTAGIVLSRMGLWGFDLAVQDIVQEVSSVVYHNDKFVLTAL
jgi:iron-regulated transporter 1